jgi:hypothetical protein
MMKVIRTLLTLPALLVALHSCAKAGLAQDCSSDFDKI